MQDQRRQGRHRVDEAHRCPVRCRHTALCSGSRWKTARPLTADTPCLEGSQYPVLGLSQNPMLLNNISAGKNTVCRSKGWDSITRYNSTPFALPHPPVSTEGDLAGPWKAAPRCNVSAAPLVATQSAWSTFLSCVKLRGCDSHSRRTWSFA
jgi:hypothetical protein